MKIWQIIVISSLIFLLLYLTLLIFKWSPIFTGKLILTFNFGVSLSIILLFTSVILLVQQFKKERIKKIKEQEELAKKLYKELIEYLSREDYFGAEALLGISRRMHGRTENTS